MYYNTSIAPTYTFGYSQNLITPFGGFPVVNVFHPNINPIQNTPVDLPAFDFDSAQKMFEDARKKAATFRRDCYSLYEIEHDDDKAQNETYRHICTSYSQDNLKQYADLQDYGLFFIAKEVVAADGSRYTLDGRSIYNKANYIPQDGFVYHASAGILFDVSEFEAVEDLNSAKLVDESDDFEVEDKDDLSLSFFSDDSSIAKTSSDLSCIFDGVCFNEDKKNWSEMAMKIKPLTEIRKNTIDAYQTVRLNKFFSNGFTSNFDSLYSKPY